MTTCATENPHITEVALPNVWIPHCQLTLEQRGFELHGSTEMQLIEKNVHTSGPIYFRPVWFKGQVSLRMRSWKR